MPKRTHDGIKKRCDCPKKQWAKCCHPWWFNFHHGGREHRYSLDTIAHSRTSASSFAISPKVKSCSQLSLPRSAM